VLIKLTAIIKPKENRKLGTGKRPGRRLEGTLHIFSAPQQLLHSFAGGRIRSWIEL